MKKDEAKPAPAPAGSKICITARGKDFEAEVDPDFSQARYYLLLDPMAMTLEVMENPHRNAYALPETGTHAAQFLKAKSVGVVITGEIAPPVQQALHSSEIQFITGTSGKVKDVIQSLAKGVK